MAIIFNITKQTDTYKDTYEINCDLLHQTHTLISERCTLSVQLFVRNSGETGNVLMLRMSHSFPVSGTVCCVSNLTVLVGR